MGSSVFSLHCERFSAHDTECARWLALAIVAGVMCALLFGMAGMMQYWEAWVYVAIFLMATRPESRKGGAKSVHGSPGSGNSLMIESLTEAVAAAMSWIPSQSGR